VNNQHVKVAITLDDGRVAIMGFVTVGRGPKPPDGGEWINEAAGLWKREPSDANIFQEIARTFTLGAQPTSYRIVKDDELPTDRTYRNAWKDDGKGKPLTHDIAKAREIHLRQVREVRGPKLDQLDRDWMRAFGTGDTVEAARIEAKRQELRDLPATLGVDKAKNVEELKALKSPLLEK
jgi:hypothetical protein